MKKQYLHRTYLTSNGERAFNQLVFTLQKRGKSKKHYTFLICRGCGKKRPVSKALIQSISFSGLCLGCYRKKFAKTGSDHYNFKGGKFETKNGYVQFFVSADHPFAVMRDCRHNIYEHRLVMAQMIGRPLTKNEVVHHLNGIKNDNRPENLELVNGHTHLLITKMESRIRELEAALAFYKRRKSYAISEQSCLSFD